MSKKNSQTKRQRRKIVNQNKFIARLSMILENANKRIKILEDILNERKKSEVNEEGVSVQEEPSDGVLPPENNAEEETLALQP